MQRPRKIIYNVFSYTGEQTFGNYAHGFIHRNERTKALSCSVFGQFIQSGGKYSRGMRICGTHRDSGYTTPL